MRATRHNTNMSGLALRRVLAAAIPAAFVALASCVAITSRNPLQPLRAVNRWSLHWRGARFVAQGHARLQSSLNDCGPTALADLLELTGVRVPPRDTLRALSALQSRGTTLGDLGIAAAYAGLRVFPVQWDPHEIAQLPLPSLVWVDRGHFVVVAHRIESDSVEVYDPAAGRYRIASDRFVGLWSGEALIPLDSISSYRDPRTSSAARSHRPRGTRAVRSTLTEV
jgi:ABC-type bacteriocin/lantibiotic exporter with double-glycine peptidase domain